MDKQTALLLSGMTDKEIRGEIKKVLETTTATTKRGSSEEQADLYSVWIAGVMGGTVKPVEGVFADFVNEYMDSKAAGLNKSKLATMWDSFGIRGISDGRLVINPEYSHGNRKIKYLLAA